MGHEALLKTLLLLQKDGVIVCNSDAVITLFNQAAVALFEQSQLLRSGNSLYSLCLQPPVEHGLDFLQYQQDSPTPGGQQPFIQFINATTGLDKFLLCRLSLLPPQVDQINFFVIIFEDVSAWYRPDNPLFMTIEEFRAPMTNLRAAVENLTEHPEMSPVMRSAFENVLVQESLNLTSAFDSLARSCNLLLQAQSHLSLIGAEVLFGYVASHLHKKNIHFTAATGQSAGMKIDSYGLILVLDYLADRIQQEKKGAKLSCEAHIGDQFVYLDFIWPGEFIPTAAVEAMLEEKLPDSVGRLTVAGILNSMDGDIWSQKNEGSGSTLRLALPIVMQSG